jgi:predicted transcriptional regulator
MACPAIFAIPSASRRIRHMATIDTRVGALLDRYYAHFDADELPIPVESIAVDLLGLVVEEDEALAVSGLLVPVDHHVWLNGREARQSPGRRRFTLAHEVGHWICHYEQGRVEPKYCRSEEIGVGVGRAREREANAFAAQLLMPEALVRREAAALRLNVHALARRFEVSLPAMKVRLQQLSLLPAYMQ